MFSPFSISHALEDFLDTLLGVDSAFFVLETDLQNSIARSPHTVNTSLSEAGH
jgi:hypothetical protein